MIIESVFESQQPIPSQYTGDGADISPPLRFLQLPSNAKSLALIVDDPDAPRGTFDHWIVWNIPPATKELSEGAPELRVGAKSKQGINGFGQAIYRGPAPPPGKPHRYFFKLYALDRELAIPEGSKKHDLEEAMKGHVIEKAELIGTYQR